MIWNSGMAFFLTTKNTKGTENGTGFHHLCVLCVLSTVKSMVYAEVRQQYGELRGLDQPRLCEPPQDETAKRLDQASQFGENSLFF
jgi:hypothetical protein